MDQLPAVPPHVSYQDGLLTIVAQNSTLADILREVRKRTGASIDVPANATERVVARLGPGPSRDVLASLLNGSAFNYVMLGSASDPAALSAVLLTTKSGANTGGTAADTSVAMANPPSQGFAPPNGVPQGVGALPATPAQADADDSDDSDDSADDEDAKDEANTNSNNNQGPANAMQEINPGNVGLGELDPEKLEQLRERMKPPQPLPQFPPPPNNQPQ